METILVVEDDKLLGKSIVAVLEDEGFAVRWAKNSDEVFASLADTQIDLIYLDIMLPGGLDGYEILRKIKMPGSMWRNIPVIMLSNLGQMDEIDKAIELGALDYIIKANVDLDKFIKITNKTLSKY